MMKCCLNEESLEEAAASVNETQASDPNVAPELQDDPRHGCKKCGAASHPVTRKTMLLMLKPEQFEHIGDADYRFCSYAECRIVYFTEGEGATFTTNELRVRVGLKEKEDPIPLCYCFGFYKAEAQEEIRSTGRSTVSQRIGALIKQGMCACPERNPSGACCLGEVNKVIKRLLSEAAHVKQTP